MRPVTKKETNRKLELGVFYSPDYCLHTIKPIPNSDASVNQYNKRFADLFKTIDAPGFGYTLGADVICHFTKKLSLKTGFYYAVRTSRYNGFVFYESRIPDFAVYPFANYRKDKTSFFEIPFAFNYSFCHADPAIHKFRWSCFAGLIFSINNRKQTIETSKFLPAYYGSQSGSSYDGEMQAEFSVLYAGVLAGLKAEYMLNDKLSLGLSPMLKYFPGEFYRSGHTPSFGNLIKRSPYSIGCGIGVTYFFYT